MNLDQFILAAVKKIQENGGKVPAHMEQALGVKTEAEPGTRPITVNELKRQAKLITQTIMYGHLN